MRARVPWPVQPYMTSGKYAKRGLLLGYVCKEYDDTGRSLIKRAGRCATVRLCRDLVNRAAFDADVHASSPIIFIILMDLNGVALHHPLRRPRRDHMCRFALLDTRLGGGVLAGALSQVFLVSSGNYACIYMSFNIK